ncbi:MAG: hypothetical protein JNM43_13825 [Planctomycetaceae bacterium]|nr:hypothetical protein [Planctomycetaceae bacterium]
MSLRKFCLSLVLVFAAGCGGDPPADMPKVELIPVTGVIQVDGKPVSGARVALHSPGGNSDVIVNPNGITDAEGKFQLTTYSVHDGAPAGVWAVTVSWADILNPGASEPEYGKEKLPIRYQAPTSSGLSLEVKPDASEPVLLSLKSR